MTRIDAILLDLAPGPTTTLTLVPRLNALISLAQNSALPFRLLLNNSWHDEKTVRQNWAGAGVKLLAEHIQLPAPFLAYTLSHQTPRATVFALTSDHVKKQLGQAGLRVIDNPEEIGYLCDYVVTGTFPGYSYKNIVSALRCREMGARFAAVEQEPLYEHEGLLFPAGAPTAAAVQTVFGQPPEFIAAMPNPDWITYVLKANKIVPENALLLTFRDDAERRMATDTGVQMLTITNQQSSWDNALQHISRQLAITD